MQLATAVDNTPWVCNVYYVSAAQKLYWLSFPQRRHSQEIAVNARAAATVMIKPTRPVIGVQVEGMATIVSDPPTVQSVMRLYVEKYGEGDTFYSKFIEGSNKHALYCLEPISLVLFDEVHFPDDGRQVVPASTVV